MDDHYSDMIKVPCRPELAERVDQAAAAQFMRPVRIHPASAY
jgi:hypothetical protein